MTEVSGAFSELSNSSVKHVFVNSVLLRGVRLLGLGCGPDLMDGSDRLFCFLPLSDPVSAGQVESDMAELATGARFSFAIPVEVGIGEGRELFSLTAVVAAG